MTVDFFRKLFWAGIYLVLIFFLSTHFVIKPAQAQENSTLYTFDLRPITNTGESYDKELFVTTLQGIVNQNRPQLFIYRTDVDQYWLSKMQASGEFLENYTLHPLQNLQEMINIFGNQIDGVVLYDPNVPATSNVATTIAGVENLAVVRYDLDPNSLYSEFVLSGPRLPVKKNLVGMFTGSGTGSKKNDAYIWAKEQYLDNGKVNPELIAFYLDSYALTLISQGKSLNNRYLAGRDYLVQRKGFVFDLDPWDDETPVDDPNQPIGTDFATLKEILLSAYNKRGADKIGKVLGFAPHEEKYSTLDGKSKHEAWETERTVLGLVSSYNNVLEVEAPSYPPSDMANGSIFYHVPKLSHYVQNPPPTKDFLIQKGYLDQNGQVAKKTYLLFFMGDYENTSWIYTFFPQNSPWGNYFSIWDDLKRGQIPLAWDFSPHIIEHTPFLINYLYKTKTFEPSTRNGDYFVSAAGGSGNNFIDHFIPPRPYSNLPSGLKAWSNYNLAVHRRSDIKITIFLTQDWNWSRLTEETQEAAAYFAPDGIGFIHPFNIDPFLYRNTVPIMSIAHWIHYGGGSGNKEGLYRISEVPESRPNFIIIRSMLVNPTYVMDFLQAVKTEHPEFLYEAVDPYTFYYLMRIYKGGNNDYRSSFLSDSLPEVMEPGKTYPVTIRVRNDGWDVWEKEGYTQGGIENYNKYLLASILKKGEIEHVGIDSFPSITYTQYTSLSKDVPPGESETFSFQITAPNEEGVYTFQADMYRHGFTWFESRGNIPWQKKIIIKTIPTFPGDYNSDGHVDILDLRQLLQNFTNIFDYNILVGNFGK